MISHRLPQVFDPLSLSDGAAPGDIKKWREAEIKHGRVAMLASLGVIVAEVRDVSFIIYHVKLLPAERKW